MIFILGLITGVLLALIVFMVSLWQKPTISRAIKQTESSLKQKGSIIEPDSDELDDWLKKLPNE